MHSIKIRAIQSNEQIPGMFMNGSKDGFDETNSVQGADKFESLNNLVGGTSNLLELKFGSGAKSGKKMSTGSLYQQSEQLSPSKLNLSNLKTIEEQNASFEQDDLQLIDITKDRKELEAEFDQVNKKISNLFSGFMFFFKNVFTKKKGV